jgi:ferredoxin, 2Fe-2S
MAAATPAGYVWPTACGGTALRPLLDKGRHGPEHLDEPSQIEVGLLQTHAARRLHGDSVRPACQAGIRGDLAVHKSGVRPRDASDAALAPLAHRL